MSAGEKYNLVKLVDEIVYALPKEKTITVFKAVNDEFKSAVAGEHVKQGVWEVIVEAIGTVVDGVVEVAHAVADVEDNIKDYLDDLKPWWWRF